MRLLFSGEGERGGEGFDHNIICRRLLLFGGRGGEEDLADIKI